MGNKRAVKQPHDGRMKHPVYRRWCNMIGRCEKPYVTVFKWYGARGISVCDRWHNFWLFAEDVGLPPTDKHTLDRIDSNGNYEPGNVRWATQKQQANNRRNKRLFEFNGKKKTLTEWASITGIPMLRLYARISRLGWSVGRALTTPPDATRTNFANRAKKRAVHG